MVNDPKTPVWMVDDGDELAGGVRDFIILPLEVDGVIVIDPPFGAQ